MKATKSIYADDKSLRCGIIVKMKTIEKMKSISADGKLLRRGMIVYCIRTMDAGATWFVIERKVAHTNHRGRITFDEKIMPFSAWYPCLLLNKQVGDHRIYATKEAADLEIIRRNKSKKGKKK